MSGDSSVNENELKKAFLEVDRDGKRANRPKKPWKKLPIVIFIIGVVAIISGLSFLIYKIVTKPSVADADFLISAGEWVQEDDPTVIWDFTEVGKGKLTTDGHLNDYNFVWSLDSGKLKIETSWLYNLNDEFDYSLDQNAKILVIKNHDKNIEVKFKVPKD